MEIGTIETESEDVVEKTRKSRGRSRGGRGRQDGGNGGGGGDEGPGGGGGGDRYRDDDLPVPDNTMSEKSRILMWFLLLVVLMTFGGLIGAYVVIAANGALEWRPFSLPPQVWYSTFLIIASSGTYHFARMALENERADAARMWFIATAALGAFFISSQILAWMALVDRGLYMRGNPYAGFFYILTAVHAVHVAGGIAALGYVILRTWNHEMLSAFSQGKNIVHSKVIGWYWHTMDLLWLLLLFLLGFWK